MVSLRRWEKLIAKRIASTVGLADGAPGCGSLCVRWVSVMLDAMARSRSYSASASNANRVSLQTLCLCGTRPEVHQLETNAAALSEAKPPRQSQRVNCLG